MVGFEDNDDIEGVGCEFIVIERGVHSVTASASCSAEESLVGRAASFEVRTYGPRRSSPMTEGACQGSWARSAADRSSSANDEQVAYRIGICACLTITRPEWAQKITTTTTATTMGVAKLQAAAIRAARPTGCLRVIMRVILDNQTKQLRSWPARPLNRIDTYATFYAKTSARQLSTHN